MSYTYLVPNEWFFHRGGRNTSPGNPDGAGIDGVHPDSIGRHEGWVAPSAFWKGGEIQKLTRSSLSSSSKLFTHPSSTFKAFLALVLRKIRFVT